MRPAKWLDFHLSADQPPSGKTQVWLVYAKAGGQLGDVRWSSRWRTYAFFPLAGTLYEPTCLRDIAQFIEDRMKERRSKARPSRRRRNEGFTPREMAILGEDPSL